MSKKRILFLVPSLRRAGAENQAVQLVNGLSDADFDKHLLSYLPEKDLVDVIDANSVAYHFVPRQRKVDTSVAATIGEIIDKNQIDIIHCTLENALLYGFLGRRYAARQPRLICAIHTTKQATIKHELADWLLYRHLLKKCVQVWFMCRMQADLWIRRMPFLCDRAKVVYNGIQISDFNPASDPEAGSRFRGQLGIATDAKVICCVAGLRPEKNHLVLLRSFKRFVDSGNMGSHLLLAGTGEMESRLTKLVEQLGLDASVTFLGGMDDVRPVLAASDCKVLASKAETFSMAMLEAMAMQVPVICTKVGGAGEAIDDRKNGVLVTPGAVDELAAAMEWLLSDDDRRAAAGQAARKIVEEKFTYAKMIENSHDCLLHLT
ncbi:MAG: glycosyltransferase family 4 protein [Woeseiaceae bacterium]